MQYDRNSSLHSSSEIPKALAALGTFQRALNNISKGSTSSDFKFPIFIPTHVRTQTMAVDVGLELSHGRRIHAAI